MLLRKIAGPLVVFSLPLAVLLMGHEIHAQNTAPSTLDQLPSYQYDPRMDSPLATTVQGQASAPQPHVLGPSQARAPQPPYMGLETRSGIDLGAQASYYQYKEPNVSSLSGPNVNVQISGLMIGLNPIGTLTFGHGYFVSGDVRYAFGPDDYKGSGTLNDSFNDLWDVRGLFGKDFLFQNIGLSPYLGLGYRDLYNDNRGITSTGAAGYRRENQIYYLPLGIKPRFHLDSVSRVTATVEYDAFLSGQQKSYLSDTGSGDPDISNSQHSGYGLRGDLMYETHTWALGPFFNYWNIGSSSSTLFYSPNATCGGRACIGTEPANHTYEAGVQFRYHFL